MGTHDKTCVSSCSNLSRLWKFSFNKQMFVITCILYSAVHCICLWENDNINPHYCYIIKDFNFLFFLKILFINFLERREGRERETLMCERYIYQLPLAHPQPGTWPATQACDLTGNRTGDPWVCRQAPNPLSHTGQG